MTESEGVPPKGTDLVLSALRSAGSDLHKQLREAGRALKLVSVAEHLQPGLVVHFLFEG